MKLRRCYPGRVTRGTDIIVISRWTTWKRLQRQVKPRKQETFVVVGVGERARKLTESLYNAFPDHVVLSRRGHKHWAFFGNEPNTGFSWSEPGWA
jgi:hypothetical protein